MVDALLGRNDRSLRVLSRKLLGDHALLVALKIESGEELVLDSLALGRRVAVLQDLGHLLRPHRIVFIINKMLIL